MLNIFSGARAWSTSTFSELPEIKSDAPQTLQHFCVVAGGLALILSRLSPLEIRTRFRATEELYRSLRHQLRKRGKTNADVDMISEVMHEVAQVADPHTRSSLKACLHARSSYEQERAGTPSSRPHSDADAAMTQSAATTRAHVPAGPEHTRVDDVQLEQRARSLRDTVQRARTAIGEIPAP